jgi:hypothetical protein
MASSSSGSRQDDEVHVDAVPRALRDRLGSEGTGEPLQVLDLAEREWSDDVLSLAGERFEHRLAESASGLRVQIAQSEAALRGEMAQMEVRILGRILSEIANGRSDLIKWSFLFWIGQVVAMSAVMAALLRMIR